MSSKLTIPTQRVFCGWFVVAAAFAVCFMGFGSAYTFSAFVAPLQNDFAASRGSVSLVFSLAGFLDLGLGIISGPLADRWGSRRLAVAGMILTGAGLAAAGFARTLMQVYAAYGLGVGLGVGLAYVPALGAVQRWFARRRGFASGLAVSGIGVGTLVMPPLAAFFIATLGWRQAYFVLGAFAAVIGAGMALMIENDPHDRGLGPDGDSVRLRSKSARPPGASILEAVRTQRFRSLYLACLICSLGVFVPFVHLVPYAVDHGVPPSSAVLLLGMIGVGSTAGRFFLGGTGRPYGAPADPPGDVCRHGDCPGDLGGLNRCLVARCLRVRLRRFLRRMGRGPPAVVMDSFGGRNVGGLIGILYTSVAFGTLIGPSAAGFAFDVSHSHTLAIVGGVCANVIAACIVGIASRAPIPAGLAVGQQ